MTNQTYQRWLRRLAMAALAMNEVGSRPTKGEQDAARERARKEYDRAQAKLMQVNTLARDGVVAMTVMRGAHQMAVELRTKIEQDFAVDRQLELADSIARLTDGY